MRSATDRELLAGYRAVRHFRHILEGRQFTLFTDHEPLVGMMKKSKDPWSATQVRHLATISEFTTDIRHIQGKTNIVADTLSPGPVDHISLGVDFNALTWAQQLDQETSAAWTVITDLQLRDINFEGQHLLCDVSRGTPRPWVPEMFRRMVFQALHNLSHPGKSATTHQVSNRFARHGLKKDIANWTAACVACQRVKVHRHAHSPLQKVPVPDSKFTSLSIDLVGPLPPSQGFTHILTIIDRFSKWPEAIPISATDTATVERAFLSGWVWRYGVPGEIISDGGPQFVSQLWTGMARLLGTSLHQTTAYHPQANGLVERLHRQLKASIMLGIRTAPKDGLGASPVEMTFGAPLRLLGKFCPLTNAPSTTDQFLRGLRQATSDLKPVPTSAHRPTSAPCIPVALRTCPFIFVCCDGHKPPLQPKHDGPYPVLDRQPKFFRLRLGEKEDTFSIDHLKPANVPDDTVPALPRRRGRPRQQPTTPSPPTLEPPTNPPKLPESAEPQITRTGQQVHKPVRYIANVGGGHVAGERHLVSNAVDSYWLALLYSSHFFPGKIHSIIVLQRDNKSPSSSAVLKLCKLEVPPGWVLPQSNTFTLQFPSKAFRWLIHSSFPKRKRSPELVVVFELFDWPSTFRIDLNFFVFTPGSSLSRGRSTKSSYYRPGVGNLFGWESHFLAERAIFFTFFDIFFNKCSHQKSHIWLESHRLPTPVIDNI